MSKDKMETGIVRQWLDRSGHARIIGFILAAAAVIKLPLLALNWGLVEKDGIHYVAIAKRFAAMDIVGALSLSAESYLPFYPLLIALFHGLGVSWATSAIMVSFVCGVLAVVPFYFLVNRLFDVKFAAVASLFFAMSPEINFVSTAIGSDSAFLLLFVLAVWVLWLAHEKGSLWYLVGFAVAALLAASTRNAGIVLFPLCLFWVYRSYRHDRKKLVTFIAIAGGLAAVTVALLQLYSSYTGRLPLKVLNVLDVLGDLSFVKGGVVVEELKLAEDKIYGGRYYDFFEMATHYIHVIYLIGTLEMLIKACGYAISPFVAAGLFAGERAGKGCERSYLLTIAVLFVLTTYVFMLKNYFAETRYLLPAALALLPFGGPGYQRVEEYLKKRFSLSEAAIASMVALLVLGAAVYKINSKRKDYSTYGNQIEAIRWVRENVQAAAAIATNAPAIPFSAERSYVKVDCSDLDECMEEAAGKGTRIDYFIYKTPEGEKLAATPSYAVRKVFLRGRSEIYVLEVAAQGATSRQGSSDQGSSD
ncbi:MAG TPA: hypothetical protein ENJ37_03330 [Deltaproteobacteria bacterium]|nr:hypothetical protein [Deltaproteobacteria bacterium]